MPEIVTAIEHENWSLEVRYKSIQYETKRCVTKILSDEEFEEIKTVEYPWKLNEAILKILNYK